MNGDGEQTRDFTYVENAVQANIRGMFSGDEANNEVVNIAYGDRISLNTLWSDLKEVSDTNLEALYGPPRRGDVRDSLANIEKAKKLIGYDPKFSVAQGLKVTWDYFKNS
jgi:UDP-N-acetylglucosamine 4-epimerase